MNLTLDQYDTIHMHLRRATAITRLLAEACEGRRELIEVPAKDVGTAMHLAVEHLEDAQVVLRAVSSPENKVPEEVDGTG